jgi:hypothetical protein
VTSTYNLRVVLRDNSVEVRQITIYVEPVAQAPRIERFTVDPPSRDHLVHNATTERSKTASSVFWM